MINSLNRGPRILISNEITLRISIWHPTSVKITSPNVKLPHENKYKHNKVLFLALPLQKDRAFKHNLYHCEHLSI